MLRIRVHRYGFGRTSTLGHIDVSSLYHAFTLEDERRKVKKKHETCIPPGQYVVKLRDEGGMNKRYRERFPETHQGMLWLQDVPGFEWIYIHVGNKESHTSGCILVGDVPVVLPDGEFEIARSTDAYLRLYKLCLDALGKNEKVVVEITEDER